MKKDIKEYLDACVEKFNTSDFIENDPLSIPHRFSVLQDIEITAFWTATLAWGQRKTIINSATKLCELMTMRPMILLKTILNPTGVLFLILNIERSNRQIHYTF